MEFTLNGKKKTFHGDPERLLLDYLREEAGFTGAKDGCSGEGTCGACSVIMDGRAVLACTTRMKRVEGRAVTTIEGLDASSRDAFADAFVESGGIQCGFCTPGIVMSAKALLDKNRDPSGEQIAKAIQINLCRCTGYKKVIESIEDAAASLRGANDEKSREPGRPAGKASETCRGKIGDRLPKYEARETVLGARPFVADLAEPGMLHGALRFSDHPRAKILSIDAAEALKIPGVIRVVSAKDIPGKRHIGLIVNDWPLMVAEGEQTRYVGDVICGVVADTEKTARKAAEAVKVEYEVLPPLCDPREAMKPESPNLHPGGNILSASEIRIGDAGKALAACAHVTSGTYTTPRIEHAFLEPECCLARPWTKSVREPDGSTGVEIFSQGQGAYEDRRQVSAILGLAPERVNVIQVQNGGAFGGKEDLTVQGHAALFAWLSKKPVRVALTRVESLRMHPKRHPFEMRYTVGCDKNGKLTALKARMVCDTGAYASVGMKVIERAVAHAAGAYTVPAVDLHGVAVYTNNIPSGAMRGFGVPQAAFAMESCIDELCEKGGFDRWQFRWDNAITEGSQICTGQVMKHAVGVRACLEALKPRFRAAKFAGIAAGIKNTGIGCGMPDVGRVKIVVERPDKVVIHHGWTEMGQGVHTVAAQCLAEETGIDPGRIEVRVETREQTPCGMTTSSRATSLVGHSIIAACGKLKEDLATRGLSDLVGREYHGEWACDWTTKVGVEKKGVETCTHYSYSYAAQMVELDEQGRIKSVIAAHDAGRIVNPTLFEGQIEGSVHMGLGYALSEQYPMKDGRPVHTQLVKCGILRAPSTPPVEVIGVEVPDPSGPYGAKGIGEIGLVPTAAAVANAFYQFDGERRRHLPCAAPRSARR